MRNLGLAFLALGVLFMGGCSLFFTVSAIMASDHLTGAILTFSLPLLALALLFGWWAIRVRNGPYRHLEGNLENKSGIGVRLKSYKGREILREESGVSVDGKHFSNVIEAEKWVNKRPV